jgi:hypothetical protein
MCVRPSLSMSIRTKEFSPALKHGGYSATALLPGEDPAAFEKLRTDLVAELVPNGSLEGDIVATIARLLWRKQNIATFRAAAAARHKWSEALNAEARIREWDRIKRVHTITRVRSGSGTSVGRGAIEFRWLKQALSCNFPCAVGRRSNRLSANIRSDRMVSRPPRLLAWTAVKSAIRLESALGLRSNG